MLQKLEPKYAIPFILTEKCVPALYDEMRGKVEKALQSAQRVALTCDG